MKTKAIITERVASAAAYLPFLGRIILMFLPTRRSPAVRFHVYQATLFGFVSTVLLAAAFCWRTIPCFDCFLNAFAVIDLSLLITLALTAFFSRPIKLPVLGSIARKLADVKNPKQVISLLNHR